MLDAAVLDETIALLRAGDTEAALTRAKPSLPPLRSEAAGYKLLGDELLNRHHHADALRAYDQALAREPNFVFALCNAAIAHKALGAVATAEQLCRRAYQLRPGDPAVLKLLGELSFLGERYQESVDFYDALLALKPGDRSALYHRAKSMIGLEGRLDDPATLFSAIYANQAWGNLANSPHRFFSGAGSHKADTVAPYIAAVGRFLQSLGHRPDVVDIGCGDFNIGSNLRPFCGRYVALDVVPDLIAYNTERFAGIDVEFAQLDVTRQAPPVAEVYFIREVFQHLSNAQIASALPHIGEHFRHLVFTEAVPRGAFTPNLDKAGGERARVYFNNSGVVLTEAPFNARFGSERVLCTVERDDGSAVVTRLYTAA